MADGKKRKSGGAKLARTETVTVRLDERLRYLAELAARKQRRTTSSFVEWAIQDSLERTVLKPASAHEPAQTVASEASTLWDVDASGRFLKLAAYFPELLTHAEQVQLEELKETHLLDYVFGKDGNAGNSGFENTDGSSSKENMSARLAIASLFWRLIRETTPEELIKKYLPSIPSTSSLNEAIHQTSMAKSQPPTEYTSRTKPLPLTALTSIDKRWLK